MAVPWWFSGSLTAPQHRSYRGIELRWLLTSDHTGLREGWWLFFLTDVSVSWDLWGQICPKQDCLLEESPLEIKAKLREFETWHDLLTRQSYENPC